MNYPFADRWYWQDGPDNDVVVSTRVRLLRNITGYPFPSRIITEQRKKIHTQIADVFDGKNLSGLFERFILDELSLQERMVFLEDSLLQQNMSQGDELYVNNELSCLVNSSDHLRLTCFKSGHDIQSAFQEVVALEEALGEDLAYAATMELGFLTASSTNLGTGLKVSSMLHLRGLAETNSLEAVFKKIGHSVSIRGYFNHKAHALGDFYQISNFHTLGISEKDIIQRVGNVSVELVQYERRARYNLLQEKRSEMEALVHNSYDRLKNAGNLDAQEAIKLLSDVRFGVELGLIEDIGLSRITSLYFLCQKYHVLAAEGADLEENHSRAELVSRIIKN